MLSPEIWGFFAGANDKKINHFPTRKKLILRVRYGIPLRTMGSISSGGSSAQDTMNRPISSWARSLNQTESSLNLLRSARCFTLSEQDLLPTHTHWTSEALSMNHPGAPTEPASYESTRWWADSAGLSLGKRSRRAHSLISEVNLVSISWRCAGWWRRPSRAVIPFPRSLRRPPDQRATHALDPRGDCGITRGDIGRWRVMW